MLSGGQRKRVGLAQVLIRDPKILLMDEPFGPLDAQTRQIMGNLLLDLWSADRKAVLFVTHDLEEAIALADRVVIMSAGPSARIIGDWRVALPRPRDITEVKLDKEFHALHREIWDVLKDEVMKGYAQSTQIATKPAERRELPRSISLPCRRRQTAGTLIWRGAKLHSAPPKSGPQGKATQSQTTIKATIKANTKRKMSCSYVVQFWPEPLRSWP